VPPILFDAVFFDLDGTLIATDRFWIESAERGARLAFRELGLTRPLPTPQQWLSLVGLPLEVGFRSLFPELAEDARRTVLLSCVAEEEAQLRRDGVPAMPGARELLRRLHARGLALGIASNCQQSYLDHMLDGLELRPLVRGAWCRESPGIGSKGDMLERLLTDLGTRSAVMVGDRSSDRDAAWENGLPHVHCAFGFAQGDEGVTAEGRIGALQDLEELLERRGLWIERALERVGAFGRPGLRLGVTGGPAAGKTLFARDAARVLRARGHVVAAVSLSDFAPATPDPSADPLESVLDLARLERELLRPHEAGHEVTLTRPDLLGEVRVPAGATLVLEGSFLLGAKLRTGLDRLIHLDLPETVSWRRLHGREGRRGGSLAVASALETALPLQRALEQRFPPRATADLVLDGTNPLGTRRPFVPAPGTGASPDALGGEAPGR
jgi:phosphoglycolate phosphatase